MYLDNVILCAAIKELKGEGSSPDLLLRDAAAVVDSLFDRFDREKNTKYTFAELVGLSEGCFRIKVE